jgi:LemA protein
MAAAYRPGPRADTAVSVAKRVTAGNLSVSSVDEVQAVVIVGGVAVVLFLAVVVSHNRFVSQRQLIDNAWANVDSELRRRYDLIPNLVRTVEGYATHERELLRAVVAARNDALHSDGAVEEQVGPERALVRSLKSLLALSEAYPDLKADAHFLELQQELAITEDRIQAARRLFNGNVRAYNQRVQSVPSNLVAAVWGFRRHDYFELEPAVRDAGPPRVETP